MNHDYKNNNERNFQFTKLSFVDFVPTDRRRQTVKNWPAANLSFVDFRSQPRRNAITKATEYVAFGFSFRMLVFFKEGLNATVCERYGFFSVLAAVIQENGEVGVLST